MASVGHVKCEVEIGPAFRAGLDVLELAGDLIDLIPEWHEKERAELSERCKGLQHLMKLGLTVGPHKKKRT